MATLRKHIGKLLFALLALSVLLAVAVPWVANGCPVGFSCGSGQTSLHGMAIIASSDHLLTHVSLSGQKDAVTLDVEGRHVVVRGRTVDVDGTPRVLIPRGCKKVEVMASGAVLRVLADDKPIQEIR
jgi:hypothetical protein